MTGKDYRRDWAQEQARAKLRELRGQGLSDVRIGKLVGGSRPITGVYIGAILRDKDPKPVSQRVIDGLIANASFRPAKPGDPVEQEQPETVNDPRVVGLMERMTANVERLTQLLLEERERLARCERENEELRRRLAEKRPKAAR